MSVGAGDCGGEPAENVGVSVGVIVGIIIAILASTASNLGVNVQKFAFMKEEERNPGKNPAYLKLWRWWIGMALVIFGAIGDFVAFALAPQTIVTPVGSFTLVTNVLFAHFWLKEDMAKQDLVGTVLIVLGATLAVMFGDKSEKCYTLNQLLELYNRPAMYIYAAIVLLAIIIMYYIVKRSEKLLQQMYEYVEEVVEDEGEAAPVAQRKHKLNPITGNVNETPQLTPNPLETQPTMDIEMVPVEADDDVDDGDSPDAANGNERNRSDSKADLANNDSLKALGKVVSRRRLKDAIAKEQYEKLAKLHPLCYAGLAGTFGAQTVMLAKSTAEIVKTTINGDNQLVYFFTYVILLGMLFTIAMEQHWLATGLKFFDALYIVPVFQAFFIGVSVLGGAVYFGELSNFDFLQGVMFPVGVIMCLSGVMLLSMRSMYDAEDEDELEDEDFVLEDAAERGGSGILAAEDRDSVSSAGHSPARPRAGSQESAATHSTTRSEDRDPLHEFAAAVLPTSMGGERRRSLVRMNSLTDAIAAPAAGSSSQSARHIHADPSASSARPRRGSAFDGRRLSEVLGFLTMGNAMVMADERKKLHHRGSLAARRGRRSSGTGAGLGVPTSASERGRARSHTHAGTSEVHADLANLAKASKQGNNTGAGVGAGAGTASTGAGASAADVTVEMTRDAPPVLAVPDLTDNAAAVASLSPVVETVTPRVKTPPAAADDDSDGEQQ